METYTSTELRTKAAEILTKVRSGKIIIITHLGFPVAKMTSADLNTLQLTESE